MEGDTQFPVVVVNTASAGVWFVGSRVDAALRPLTIVSLAGFAASAVVLAFASSSPVLAYIGIIAWGLTFAGAPTLLQTATADIGGNDADVAISMLVTVFNLAVAGGGLIGGVLLATLGVTHFAWILLALALIALAIVWRNPDGFRPGHRNAREPAESVTDQVST